jgi:hypothetical protein
MADSRCDFAILTIVPEAKSAAVDLFHIGPGDWKDGLGMRCGVVTVHASDGGKHRVVVGQAVDRSNIPAFEATSARATPS